MSQPSAPTAFAKYFGLRDPGRSSFELDPRRDSELLVDIDGVWEKLNRLLESDVRAKGAPKAVIEGDFGTGKSHILRKVEHHCRLPASGYVPIYVELSGFGRRSTFFDVHKVLMRHLLEVTRAALKRFANGPDARAKLMKILEDCGVRLPSASVAMLELATPTIGDVEPDKAVAARSWLQGVRLSAAQVKIARDLQPSLFETSGPSELVGLYRALGEVEQQTSGRKPLLLIDETEAFSRVVDPDAQASIGHGIRSLFDPTNHTVGVFLGLNMPNVRRDQHPMLRPDVASRTQGNTYKLKHLNTPTRVRAFITWLWPALARDNAVPPFRLAKDAMDYLSEHLTTVRDKLLGSRFDGENISYARPDPTPRDLLAVLTTLGGATIEEKAEIVDLARLNRWLALGEATQ